MKNIIELGFSGEYSFPPYQKFGPAVRSCNIIHLVLSGKGYFTAGGITYEIGAGQAFIIFEGERVEYHADRENPWSYVWIDFSGDAALPLISKTGFSDKKRVTPPLETEKFLLIFKRLRELATTDSENLMRLSSFFELVAEFSRLFPCENMKDGKEGIAEVAKRIINANFTSTECRVEKIAEIVDISRSQLYRAFMDKFGASPKAYIDTMRIDYAKKLLTRSDMTVSEISYSVGFCEPLYFSTAFRKASKMSPSEFRKKYKAKSNKKDGESFTD